MFLSKYCTKKITKPVVPPTPTPGPEPDNKVNVADYDNIADALDAVPEHGTVVFSTDSTVNEELAITKPVTVDGNGASFNKTITVSNAEVTIKNAKLIATARSNKTVTPAIKITGSKPFTLTDCQVSGTTRNAVNISTSGKVIVSDNTFEAGDNSIYNAIEFSISNAPDITDVTIENNTFNGTLGNNGISFYNIADNAHITIKNNTFNDISVNNNPIRLSNANNNSAVFDIIDNTYNFTSEEPSADGYTGFMLLQDYSKTDQKQDFTKFTINFKNLKRGSKKLLEKGSGIDNVYYVYSDKEGILADGVNDPAVTFE